MNSASVVDRINWGRNVAARAIGTVADAYRPQGNRPPLAPGNRYLRLHVLFVTPEGNGSMTSGQASSIRHGHFDAAYTRAGDYLVQGEGVWFIGSQRPLGPLVCVETNRQIQFFRHSSPDTASTTSFGGTTINTNTVISDMWPANVLHNGSGGMPSAGLPNDTSMSTWTALLPVSFSVAIQSSDIMMDDLGRRAVVMSTESSELGVRLLLRQLTA